MKRALGQNRISLTLNEKSAPKPWLMEVFGLFNLGFATLWESQRYRKFQQAKQLFSKPKVCQ